MAVSLLGLLLSIAPSMVSVAAESSPVGTWSGWVTGRRFNFPVKLKVKNLNLGEENAEMNWTEPRKCTIKAKYAGTRANQYAFNVSDSNGEFCDLYLDGQLLLHPETGRPKRLTFTLEQNEGGRVVEATLTASP
jgi:hypothetical protein